MSKCCYPIYIYTSHGFAWLKLNLSEEVLLLYNYLPNGLKRKTTRPLHQRAREVDRHTDNEDWTQSIAVKFQPRDLPQRQVTKSQKNVTDCPDPLSQEYLQRLSAQISYFWVIGRVAGVTGRGFWGPPPSHAHHDSKAFVHRQSGIRD